MLCYVGKATEIFIFIMVVIVITSLVIGIIIIGRNNNRSKSRNCSSEGCSIFGDFHPPPVQMSFASLPNSNPSDPTVSSTTGSLPVTASTAGNFSASTAIDVA
ncbi:hypothetical protein Hanom_Chr01g00083971 [Helianthus anomalus]